MGRLDRFAKSSRRVLQLKGTTGADRAIVHSWVENNPNPAYRDWGHEAQTIGGERIMTVTKTGAEI